MRASGPVERGVWRHLVHGERLFLQKVSPKPAVAARLNYDRAFPRRYEMRDPGWDDDETPCRIRLELALVELLTQAQVPGALEYSNDFGVRMRACKDPHSAGHLD